MKKSLFLCIISFVSAVYAQILKDTTLPYGVFSTQYYQEQDEQYLNHKRHAIDTTFMKYQNYEGALVGNNFYQNLGVMGSASRPVFYEIDREIGFRAGYDAFGQFFNASKDFTYFDTRSPFSQLNYIQGSTGENALKVDLAAPITKRFNFGLQIGRFTSRKIAGRTGNKELDRLNGNFNLALYFNYLSKNNRYRVFGNSTLAWHNQSENGGYNLSKFAQREQLFDSLEVAKTRLFNDKSFSNIYRNDVKVYQNYRLTKDSLLGVFHEFGFQRCSTNVFLTPSNVINFDKILGADSYFDTTKSTYSYRFDRVENKAGVTGKIFFLEYVAFVKNRRLDTDVLVTGNPVFNNNDTSYANTIWENYAGADVKLKFFKDKLIFNAFAETKFKQSVSGYESTLLQQSLKKDQIFDFSLALPFVKMGFLTKSTSPTAFQTYMHHNNFRWAHAWDKPVVASSVYVQLEKKIYKQYFAINLNATNLQNYLYLDSTRNIARVDSNIQLLRASVVSNFTLWKIHLDSRLELASSNNETVYSVPGFIWAPKLYFGAKFKTLSFNVGAEALYVAPFYAYDYRPELGNFSAQNREKTYGKPVLSPFVNGQIKNFSFWIKYSFANQLLEKGYFTTPNYIGLPQTFIFGMNWMLYE